MYVAHVLLLPPMDLLDLALATRVVSGVVHVALGVTSIERTSCAPPLVQTTQYQSPSGKLVSGGWQQSIAHASSQPSHKRTLSFSSAWNEPHPRHGLVSSSLDELSGPSFTARAMTTRTGRRMPRIVLTASEYAACVVSATATPCNSALNVAVAATATLNVRNECGVGSRKLDERESWLTENCRTPSCTLAANTMASPLLIGTISPRSLLPLDDTTAEVAGIVPRTFSTTRSWWSWGGTKSTPRDASLNTTEWYCTAGADPATEADREGALSSSSSMG